MKELNGSDGSFHAKLDQMIEAGDYRHVREFINKTLQLNPSSHELKLRQMQLLYLTGEAQDADQVASELLAGPLAMEVLRRRAVIRLKRDEINEALADLDMALKMEPEHHEIRRQRAVLRVKSGMWTEAEADQELLETIFPDDPDLLQQRICIAFNLKKTAVIPELLDRLEILQPGRMENDPFFYVLRSATEAAGGHSDQAMDIVNEGCEKFPADSRLLVSRSLLLAKDGKFAEALTELDWAQEIDPTSSDIRYNRACILTQMKRSGEALRQYEYILRDDPLLWQARINYAVLLARLGRYRDAESAFVQAEQAAPGRADELRRVCQVIKRLREKTEKGELDTPVTQAEKVLRQQVDLERSRGNLKGAVQLIDKHLIIAPGDVDVRLMRVELLLEQNNLFDALEELDRLIRLDSSRPEAYRKRSALLLRLGQFERAAADEARIRDLGGTVDPV